MSVGYRQLGNSGLTVSTAGLGCSNLGRPNTVSFTRKGATAVVRAALESGITLFDVADTYGVPAGLSERLLGQALRGRRDDVVIATKFGLDTEGLNGRDFGVRGSRRYIVRAVEHSLRRLHTDRIDLYQFHTPDPLTPIEETLAALDGLVRQGKVLYLGHSNFAGWQIAQADHLARQLGITRFIAAQNHYNLLDRRAELEVLPAAQAFGLGVLPYYPLASGLLTGKYSSGRAPEGARLTHFRQHDLENADLRQLAAFGDFAAKRGLDEVRIAFSWLASRPAVASVIAGATRPEQVIQNAAAVGHELSADDLADLDTIFPPPPPSRCSDRGTRYKRRSERKRQANPAAPKTCCPSANAFLASAIQTR
ncbi:aldo/keto reductase [Nonomuraea sp. NPDC050790]|uniref:aldo/keto reductase n=1 Tax=Nonomuraea sp. NPDC050790 TaxID=3364371 RepID=UPI0037BDD429